MGDGFRNGGWWLTVETLLLRHRGTLLWRDVPRTTVSSEDIIHFLCILVCNSPTLSCPVLYYLPT